MQNFTFHNPVKIIFGQDTVPQIGSEAKAHGKKFLLVYGRNSIKQNGVYDTVIDSLKEAGLEFFDHCGVKSNPTLSHTREGIQKAKENQVDGIIAVGGGSVIDESKAIALGALVDHDVWDFFTGEATAEVSLPVITVLTIAATGSEMNNGMVVTNEAAKQKLGFFSAVSYPKASILDPTLTFTVPANYSAYSAVDAISHLLEGYFTQSADWTPIQDGYVEHLIRVIIDSQDSIALNPQDYQARSSFMWAASLALNGLPVAGIGNCAFPSHMIEHSLSALFDIAHGAGLSIVLPAWMSWEAIRNPQRVAKFAKNVFAIDAGSETQTALKGAGVLKDWFNQIGSPTSLDQANIPYSAIPALASNARETAILWGMDYTVEQITEVLELCDEVFV